MLSQGNQQKIARGFYDKDITSINDFIKEFCNLTPELATHNFSSYGINAGARIYVTETPEKDLKLFTDLEQVITIFQEERILTFDSNPNHGDLYPYFKRNGANQPVIPFEPIYKIIKKYYTKKFILNKDRLKAFNDRGYQSQKEYEEKQEMEKKKISEKKDRLYNRASFWIHVVYVLIILIQACFTYYFYKKSSKLEDEIKKLKSDTTIIIEADSLKIK